MLGQLSREQNGNLASGLFSTKMFSFTPTEGLAGLGSKIRIQLTTNNGSPYYDNLRLSVTEDVTEPGEVPEPATLGLLGAGLLGIAGLGRRKL